MTGHWQVARCMLWGGGISIKFTRLLIASQKHIQIRTGWLSPTSFGLRSASGQSGAESGEKRIAERSRSATSAAEPQTEAAAPAAHRNSARDERAICVVERAWSRGGQGRPNRPRNEANRALVTADHGVSYGRHESRPPLRHANFLAPSGSESVRDNSELRRPTRNRKSKRAQPDSSE